MNYIDFMEYIRGYERNPSKNFPINDILHADVDAEIQYSDVKFYEELSEQEFKSVDFAVGESLYGSKGCDYLCVWGVIADDDGNKYAVPIYAETTALEEIGEGHWENQDSERICKDERCILDKNGDFVRELNDEDEVKWVEDDERASYPYLVEAIKQYAKENNIDISHVKFEEA